MFFSGGMMNLKTSQTGYRKIVGFSLWALLFTADAMSLADAAVPPNNVVAVLTIRDGRAANRLKKRELEDLTRLFERTLVAGGKYQTVPGETARGFLVENKRIARSKASYDEETMAEIGRKVAARAVVQLEIDQWRAGRCQVSVVVWNLEQEITTKADHQLSTCYRSGIADAIETLARRLGGGSLEDAPSKQRHDPVLVPKQASPSIDVGDRFACRLRGKDQHAVCFGESQDCSIERGPFKSISVGTNFACGIDLDHAIRCFAGESPTPPRGAFSQVSVGTGAACAIEKGTDKVVCWGNGDLFGPVYGTPAEGVPDGRFETVAVGNGFACGIGIGRTGRVTCWGTYLSEHEDWDIPNEPFSSLSAAGTSMCGLTQKGFVLCWGGESGPGGVFYQVSNSQTNTCGLRADGTVACWPGIYAKSLQPPSHLRFQWIDCGDQYCCGITHASTFTCWRDERANQELIKPCRISEANDRATPKNQKKTTLAVRTFDASGVRTTSDLYLDRRYVGTTDQVHQVRAGDHDLVVWTEKGVVSRAARLEAAKENRIDIQIPKTWQPLAVLGSSISACEKEAQQQLKACRADCDSCEKDDSCEGYCDCDEAYGYGCGHQSPVAAGVLPTGGRLVLADQVEVGNIYFSAVRLWRLEPEKFLPAKMEIEHGIFQVDSLTYSRGSAVWAVGTYGRRVSLFGQRGELLDDKQFEMMELKGSPVALALAPDAKTLAILTEEAVTLRSVEDWEELWQHDLPNVSDEVAGRHLAFSPNGEALSVVWSKKKGCRFRVVHGQLESSSGELVGEWQESQPSSDSLVHCDDLELATALSPRADLIASVKVAPEGQLVVGGLVELFRPVDGEQIGAIGVEAFPTALAISDDSQLLAVTGRGWAGVWDLKTKKQIRFAELTTSISESALWLNGASLSSDNRFLVTTNADGQVQLWPLPRSYRRKPVAPFREPESSGSVRWALPFGVIGIFLVFVALRKRG